MLRADPGYPDSKRIRLQGRLCQAHEQSELRSILKRISDAMNASMPTNFLLGLDPIILCTDRTVFLEESPLNWPNLVPVFTALPASFERGDDIADRNGDGPMRISIS